MKLSENLPKPNLNENIYYMNFQLSNSERSMFPSEQTSGHGITVRIRISSTWSVVQDCFYIRKTS